MFLKVYFDESYEKEHIEIAVGGYIATHEQWNRFSKKWAEALKEHGVDYFHFREFNPQASYVDEGSQYYGWSTEKRDRFFYGLALIISETLVAVGASYPVKIHNETSGEGDPKQNLFAAFFNDVRRATCVHWPGCSGKDFSDKIHFVFDKTENETWREPLHKMHDFFAAKDERFGGLTFENDKDPCHLGLQAADFAANIYRQAETNKRCNGGKPDYRIVDLIFFHHLFPRGHPSHPFPPNMNQTAFKQLIKGFREDEKKQKRRWKKYGKKQIYYPEAHFPFVEYHYVNRKKEGNVVSEFEKFRELTKKIASVPKTEIDRREEQYQKTKSKGA